MTINSKVKNTLENKVQLNGNILPLDFLQYKGKSKSYLTFYSSSETPDFYAGDELVDSVITVTITVFSDKNYLDIIKQVKQLMIEAGFIWKGDSTDMFDDETGIYYKALDFEIERSFLNG